LRDYRFYKDDLTHPGPWLKSISGRNSARSIYPEPAKEFYKNWNLYSKHAGIGRAIQTRKPVKHFLWKICIKLKQRYPYLLPEDDQAYFEKTLK